MPTMDRRIKGCRNVHCRYNKERKHLPLDYNYCPICGEKVGLVCRECFAEIEDLGKTHFRCDACEAKKAKRAEAQREAGEGGEKACGAGNGCGGWRNSAGRSEAGEEGGTCCRASDEEGSAGGRASSEEGDCEALKEKIRGRDARRAAAFVHLFSSESGPSRRGL